jgi:hypothetical protein
MPFLDLNPYDGVAPVAEGYTPPADWLDIETGIPDGAIRMLVNDTTLATYAFSCEVDRPAGKNLLSLDNSTFENSSGEWSITTNATLTIDTTQFWQGTASLRVETIGNSPGEGCYVDKLINDVSGVNRIFSFYIKGSVGGRINVMLCDGETTLSKSLVILTDNWTRYFLSSGTSTLAYGLSCYISTDFAAAVVFYLDGIQLEDGTNFPTASAWSVGGTGNNLLTENISNIETNTDGFTTWTQSGVVIQDTIERFEGLASLKFVGPGVSHSEGFNFNCIENGIIGTTYVLSAYLKGTGNILMTVCDDAGVGQSIAITLTDNWTRYETFTRITDTYVGVQFISNDQYPLQMNTYYVDAIMLEATEFELSDFETPTEFGNYHVHWGDGTTDLFASGDTAEHTYEIGTGEPCSRGYSTFMIQIEPSIGNNLLGIRSVQHSLGYMVQSIGLLAYVLNSNTLVYSRLSPNYYDDMPTVETNQLEYCKVLKGDGFLESFGMFEGCLSLQDVDVNAMINVVNADSMFSSCESLRDIDISGMVSIENAFGMFQNCTSLQNISFGGTMNEIYLANSMFNGCTALQNIDVSSLGNVSDASSMFSDCRGLRNIDISSMVNMSDSSNMFSNCALLEDVNMGDLYNIVNPDSMFYRCESLRSLDISHLIYVANASAMLSSCFSLQNLTIKGLGSAAQSIDCWDFITGSEQLIEIDLSTSLLNSFQAIPYGNGAPMKLSSLTFSPLSPFLGDNSVGALVLNIDYCAFGSSSLDAVFTNLPTVTNSQIVSFIGNPGSGDCEPSIATAKGWRFNGFVNPPLPSMMAHDIGFFGPAIYISLIKPVNVPLITDFTVFADGVEHNITGVAYGNSGTDESIINLTLENSVVSEFSFVRVIYNGTTWTTQDEEVIPTFNLMASPD